MAVVRKGGSQHEDYNSTSSTYDTCKPAVANVIGYAFRAEHGVFNGENAQ